VKHAVIFDMDGVIVDSERQWVQSEASFLKQAIPDWSAEDFDKITGMGVKDLYQFLKSEYEFPYSWEQFWERNEQAGHTVYEEMVNLIPGFLPLAFALKKEVALGLASSSPRSWIKIVLDRFSLTELFESVVSADDVQGRSKPAPDIYLYAARVLGVDPQFCLAIEDSHHGALSAKRAGMKVLGFRNGFNGGQDLSVADTIIDGFEGRNLDSLLKLFE